MTQPFVPPLQGHLGSGSTRASLRRSWQRLQTNVNSQVGDVVNTTGNHSGTETAGGGGGQGAHAIISTLTGGSFAAGTYTLAYSGSVLDTDGWADYGSNQVKVLTKGVYQLNANLKWTGCSAGDVFYVAIKVNASVVAEVQVVADVTGTELMIPSCIHELLVNDTVSLTTTISPTVGSRTLAGTLQVALIGTVA